MQKQDNHDSQMADIFDIEYLVCHVGGLWRRLLNAKIKNLCICGTEKRILFCIARHPGLTQVQIATLLDLEPQNLMRSLDKLENQGWIQKQTAANDRRVKCLYITADAKKIISKIQAISDNVKPLVLAGIEPKDIQDVVDRLAKMRENIVEQLEIEEEK